MNISRYLYPSKIRYMYLIPLSSQFFLGSRLRPKTTGSIGGTGVGLISSETELVSRLHDHRQNLMAQQQQQQPKASNGGGSGGENGNAIPILKSPVALHFGKFGPSAAATLDRRMFQQQQEQQQQRRRQRGNEYVVQPGGIICSPVK